MVKALHQSSITSLPLLARGKVRDMYAVGDDKLLIVASDRISAFDVILDDPIPGKGQVLTELTEFWLKKLAHILPNHSTGIDPQDVVAESERDQVVGRAVVVKRLKPILVEAVARGYLIGSGWKDYQSTGALCGHVLPEGLKQAELDGQRVLLITHGGVMRLLLARARNLPENQLLQVEVGYGALHGLQVEAGLGLSEA